ncbi:ferredoxin--NADP reductase 2 [Striga asiatica]|uniref:Ferredoxin--NADP reductase 2 n=1 Tax=Striga asiatica TaxID=4170 RepID=A0A5A7QPP1_STRAF|nr:ferredoxin--NADP reductase 2 [Striga asiatica]
MQSRFAIGSSEYSVITIGKQPNGGRPTTPIRVAPWSTNPCTATKYHELSVPEKLVELLVERNFGSYLDPDAKLNPVMSSSMLRFGSKYGGTVINQITEIKFLENWQMN